MKIEGLDGEWEILPEAECKDPEWRNYLRLIRRVPEKSEFDKWAEDRLMYVYDRQIAKVGFEKAIKVLEESGRDISAQALRVYADIK